MYDVSGRSAVITGGAGGFGKAYAERLLKMGAKACIADVQEEAGAETAKELAGIYGDDKILFVKCDVTKEEDWSSMWSKAEEKLGYISILINNAGVHPNAGWKKCLEVMLWGQFLGNELAMSKMSTKKEGRGGRIINTVSLLGMAAVGCEGSLSWAGYSAANYGNVAYTRIFSAANTFGNDGVKSYAICPGLGDTDMFKSDKTQLEKTAKMRALRPEEVGQALAEALTVDKNGATLAVVPDLPLMDVPNGTGHLFVLYYAIAKLLNLVGVTPTVLGPKAVAFVSSVLVLVFLHIVAFLLDWYFD